MFAHLANPQFLLDDFDRQTTGEHILLACDMDKQLLGFIAVFEPESFIHHLYIAPRAQRRGVGTKLLAALPGWGERNHQLKCLKNNERALVFYQSCQFQIVGEGSGEDGDYWLLQH
ncbi:GNAT family N-acetyltransferase [Chitinibacter sp. SCUT-21]